MGTQSTSSTSRYSQYTASPPENYERYFVPDIGEPFARRLLDAARPAPGERVLDVATGTGIAARLAARAVGTAGGVTGLDVNPGMLAMARAVSPTGIDWQVAPVEDMPLQDASFDVVLCAMGLQFFGDKVTALREMRRVLAPDGRAVTLTPGPTPPLMEAIEGALVDHVGPGAGVFVSTVFSLHDPDEARRLFTAAGFDEVEIEQGSLSLRLAPPADFLWQYVRSTPLAETIAKLDESTRADLERDVVARCQPFVEGDGTALEPGWLIATGRVT